MREELRHLVAMGFDDSAVREAAGSGELVRALCRRLVDRSTPECVSKGDAYLAAARAVRTALVEQARRRIDAMPSEPAVGRSERAGASGAAGRNTLAPVESGMAIVELLPLDEALGEFARENPGGARVVELRYFAGLSPKEVADAMGMTERRVQRWWVWAQAWLYRRLLGRRSDRR